MSALAPGTIGATTAAKQGILVYGATGHTGKLVASRAKELGLPATLAGRNPETLRSVAEAVGLPWEAFELRDTAKLDAAIARHVAVLHIAGPFEVTSPPMVAACLRNGAHYLDVTGERNVIEDIQTNDKEARSKGIMLMPSVGYDVVPGDCLAAHLKGKLPSATHLDLGLFFSRSSEGGLSASHGTMLSGALSIIPKGGLSRVSRAFVHESIGSKTRQFDLGDGGKPFWGFSFPAAELLSTAQSTDIPNIRTYMAGKSAAPLRVLEMMGPTIVGSWPVRNLIEFGIRRLPQPDETKSASVTMITAGEARDESSGKSVRAAVHTGAGYPFTASSACEIARRVLAGDLKPGFQTPASAYGPELLMTIPGVTVNRIDIP